MEVEVRAVQGDMERTIGPWKDFFDELGPVLRTIAAPDLLAVHSVVGDEVD